MLKKFRKNSLLVFLFLTFFVFSTKSVWAIGFEFDNEWCVLVVAILSILPFIFLFVCFLLFLLIIDILFISKRRNLFKMIFIYLASFFVVSCLVLYFSRNLIINYVQFSGIDKAVFSFGKEFCYERGKGDF